MSDPPARLERLPFTPILSSAHASSVVRAMRCSNSRWRGGWAMGKPGGAVGDESACSDGPEGISTGSPTPASRGSAPLPIPPDEEVLQSFNDLVLHGLQVLREEEEREQEESVRALEALTSPRRADFTHSVKYGIDGRRIDTAERVAPSGGVDPAPQGQTTPGGDFHATKLSPGTTKAVLRHRDTQEMGTGDTGSDSDGSWSSVETKGIPGSAPDADKECPALCKSPHHHQAGMPQAAWETGQNDEATPAPGSFTSPSADFAPDAAGSGGRQGSCTVEMQRGESGATLRDEDTRAQKSGDPGDVKRPCGATKQPHCDRAAAHEHAPAAKAAELFRPAGERLSRGGMQFSEPSAARVKPGQRIRVFPRRGAKRLRAAPHSGQGT